MLEKEEVIKTIEVCAERLRVKYITEDVLEQAMLTWSYNPFANNGCFVFRVVGGFLSIPTKYKEGIGRYLVNVEKAYMASDGEMHNALGLLRQCYEEILVMGRCHDYI